MFRIFGLALLGLTLCRPDAMARTDRTATAPAGATAVTMRNLVMYPYPDVASDVTILHGTVQPQRGGQPIDLDDVTSYRIAVASAAMRLDAHDMTVLMDRHILPLGHGPIKHVEISFDEGALHMSGTMQKLGVDLPFTATATLSPTSDGEMRVHVTSMRAGDVVPKGVMDFLGMDLSSIAQPDNKSAFHLEGDDIIIPLAAMFPRPIFVGAIRSVRLTRDGLYATVGSSEVTPAEPQRGEARSFLAMRGGTIAFARLTMHDADISMMPLDGKRELGFSPRQYYAQMLGGRVIPQPDRALVAYVADFRDLPRESGTAPARH